MVDERADLGEGHREHVVQHEGEAFRRRQSVEHDEEGQPDGVGEQGLLLRIVPLAMARVRSYTSRGSSRRVRRVRSMFRQTRPTTVVSHPVRFCTPLTSA